MDKSIEVLFQDIERELLRTIRSIEINKKIYACGFWLFYCDYSVINPPCFGYNSSYEEDDDRWAPPEWEVDVDDVVYNALSPIYENITKLMRGKPDESWEELVEYQWHFYSKLCFKLNSEIESLDSPFLAWPKSRDFVIGIFEEREGEEIFEELVIGSMGYAKAKELCVI